MIGPPPTPVKNNFRSDFNRNQDPMPDLVLASSSRYRQMLLQKLGLPFTSASPNIDETPQPSETPQALTARLAEAKARALAERYPAHLIIGSDQVATIDSHILGKPRTAERACEQLRMASGRVVEFLTGLCLLDTRTGVSHTVVDTFRVHFRLLTDKQI